MAGRSSSRTVRKEKGHVLNCRCQEAVPDEIALRDEILDLKRQVMILKRTNEQNLVKFRKYEDEAKRKDREIEQLMDPRKNADVTKTLSTKGAAILMNLKDQNNSLVQMILTKDKQIRRLVAEIKTSKLYGGPSRKTETHRTEVIRLRNLLMKSREIVRENIDRRINGQKGSNVEKSVFDVSPISDGFSPREVEELKFSIQSLETHVKFLNDLLAQKNQEIMNLTEELNALKSTIPSSFGEKGSTMPNFEQRFSTSYQWQISQQSPTAEDNISEWFDKTLEVQDRNELQQSAPSSRFGSLHSGASSPKRDSASDKFDSDRKPEEVEPGEGEISKGEEININLGEEAIGPSRTFGMAISRPKKSLIRTVDGGKHLKETCFSKKVRKKRKSVIKKCKQVRKQMSNGNAIIKGKDRKKRKKNWSKKIKTDFESQSDLSKLEIHETEIEKNEFQNGELFRASEFQKGKFDTLIKKTKLEEEVEKKSEKSIEPKENSQNEVENYNSTSINNTECEKVDSKEISNSKDLRSFSVFNESCPNINNEDLTGGRENAKSQEDIKGNSECFRIVGEEKKFNFSPKNLIPRSEKMIKSFGDEEMAKCSKTESDSNSETHRIKKEICSMASAFSPEIQRELKHLYDNLSMYEEMETVKSKFLIDSSFDSSLDSENGCPKARGPQLVRVEVQMNAMPNPENDPAEKLEVNGENYSVEDDFDDDDDVIVR